jgi:aspartate aminotransferase-like enzyme
MGVENIINNTSFIANYFRNKIKNIPLEIPWQPISNALTPLKPMGKMRADEIFLYLKDHGIFVCPNGGDLKKTIFRVGHMGAITKEENDILINQLFDMKNKGIL